MKWTSILGALFMAGTLLGQNQGKADSLRPIYLADSLSGVDKMELLRQLAFNEINNPNLDGQENWQKFLSRADLALYDAKNAGRNRLAISEH